MNVKVIPLQEATTCHIWGDEKETLRVDTSLIGVSIIVDVKPWMCAIYQQCAVL